MKITEQIKIFVDGHAFDKEYQGTRTFIKEMYSILALRRDLKIYMGVHHIESVKKNFPFEHNIIFVKYNSTNRWRRLLFDIPAIIRKHQIDYAHFQYIIPLRKDCRFIVTIHDVIFNSYPQEFSLFYRITKNLLYRFSASRSEIITTVSKYSKAEIQKFLNVRNKEIYITPNGVNKRFFEKYIKHDSQTLIQKKFGVSNYILYVSRFEPRKNHFLLLKSFIDLKLYLNNYSLVFVGHKSIDNPEFNALFDKLPDSIKCFIFFYEKIEDNDLIHFYKGAELFIYPSKAEGFGIPPLEAAALEIPVICSNKSALKDFYFFGNNHVDPGEYDSFKKILERTLANKRNHEELKKISSIISEKYSWEQSAETLYQSILKNYI